MKLIKSKKALVLLATLAVAVAAAVGAYAYFTSTGTGSSSASVGNAGDWNVTVHADAANAALYPGSGVDNYTYDALNGGSGNQLLNKVTIQIGSLDSDGNFVPWTSGSCSADDFSINGGAGGATATDTYGVDPDNDYAAGAGPSSVAFTVAMLDTHLNQNDCQGVTPPILVSAS